MFTLDKEKTACTTSLFESALHFWDKGCWSSLDKRDKEEAYYYGHNGNIVDCSGMVHKMFTGATVI